MEQDRAELEFLQRTMCIAFCATVGVKLDAIVIHKMWIANLTLPYVEAITPALVAPNLPECVPLFIGIPNAPTIMPTCKRVDMQRCRTCRKVFKVGELLIKCTGPELHGESNGQHHVDCMWPDTPHAMMSTKEAQQIKLELQKCELQHSDRTLINARLDQMANNYDGYMWSCL
jgi:hypothetical protein